MITADDIQHSRRIVL